MFGKLPPLFKKKLSQVVPDLETPTVQTNPLVDYETYNPPPHNPRDSSINNNASNKEYVNHRRYADQLKVLGIINRGDTIYSINDVKFENPITLTDIEYMSEDPYHVAFHGKDKNSNTFESTEFAILKKLPPYDDRYSMDFITSSNDPTGRWMPRHANYYISRKGTPKGGKKRSKKRNQKSRKRKTRKTK